MKNIAICLLMSLIFSNDLPVVVRFITRYQKFGTGVLQCTFPILISMEIANQYFRESQSKHEESYWINIKTSGICCCSIHHVSDETNVGIPCGN
jgi:hypothetical protein